MRKLNAAQRRALMEALLYYTIGWEMREADYLIIEEMGQYAVKAEDPTVPEYAKAVADYAWDHLCGEPSDWSPENMLSHAALLLKAIDA